LISVGVHIASQQREVIDLDTKTIEDEVIQAIHDLMRTPHDAPDRYIWENKLDRLIAIVKQI